MRAAQSPRVLLLSKCLKINELDGSTVQTLNELQLQQPGQRRAGGGTTTSLLRGASEPKESGPSHGRETGFTVVFRGGCVMWSCLLHTPLGSDKGASADPAGGEEEDVGDGHPCGQT